MPHPATHPDIEAYLFRAGFPDVGLTDTERQQIAAAIMFAYQHGFAILGLDKGRLVHLEAASALYDQDSNLR